jgi:hypothetical protein
MLAPSLSTVALALPATHVWKAASPPSLVPFHVLNVLPLASYMVSVTVPSGSTVESCRPRES